MRLPSDDEIRKMETKALRRAKKLQKRIKKGKGVGRRQVRGARRDVARARNQGGCVVATLTATSGVAAAVATWRGWT